MRRASSPARLLQWIGYGQYGFMAAMAAFGIVFSLLHATPASAATLARLQALGFALLYVLLFMYSLWRLVKHHLRYR